MSGVTQRLFARTCGSCGQKAADGDCASAVVATILGLQLDDVPVFVQAGSGWWFWLEEWLRRRGLRIRTITKREELPEGRLYVAGDGGRGFSHACVWEGGPTGRVVWDPHPTRAGLVGEPKWWGVIEPAPTCELCSQGKGTT